MHWQADEYYECGEKTYAELMAMPDPEAEGNLDNDEDDQSSRPTTPTPAPLRPTPFKDRTQASAHDINVRYRHFHAYQDANGQEIDIPALLMSLAQHSAIEAPGELLQASQTAAGLPQSPSRSREKALFMEGSVNPLVFTALDIVDPPHLKYSDNMDALVLDWDKSSYLKIKDVPIPLKYWAQVFRWARPEAWNVIKDNWCNWRVSSYLRLS